MSKIYHTAIVGGGAAGLMSAVDLLRGKNSISGQDIIILEGNERVGKKLIATGNGQGNLTNANVSVDNYYGDKKFIADFIENLNKIDLKEYLQQIGVPLCFGKDGKVYPLSKQASSVLDIIRFNLLSNGVNEVTSTKVTAIKKVKQNYKLITEKGEYFAQNVIVAVGGTAAKQFGTDGKSYSLLEELGHNKTDIYPSLVQLKTESNLTRGLKGLKEVAKVTAIKDGKIIKSAMGDLLFTEFGVSGSAIFSVSAAITALQNVKLKIEFLPELTEKEIEQILLTREKLSFIKNEDALLGIVNKRVGQAVLKSAKSRSAKDIASALKNFTLTVTGNLGFNYAQVTKGGIKTDEVDSRTFESKLFNDVYIVGEVLDVDGDCGGYNLTFAFVSGILAARAIKERTRR